MAAAAHEDHGHDDHGHDDHAHHHEDHGHDHHDHAHATGLAARMKELFAPHSHDAGDSVDAELEAGNKGVRALAVSFAGLLVTTLLQAAVVVHRARWPCSATPCTTPRTR